jgi:hypothetical protein
MNAAQKIIEKFGGQSALAKLLGKGQSTIQHWASTGLIPAKWQPRLLALAGQQGIALGSSEFMEIKSNIEVLPKLPEAKWMGYLPIGAAQLPVFVLDDGRRVISRTGATGILTKNKGGGNLESYLAVEALKGYVPSNIAMVEFSVEGVVNKKVMGIEAETFIDICRCYVKAQDDKALKTDRQNEMATSCSMFLAACAKTGLIALIDEATGYQYARAEDALRVKLRAFLEKEMRPWEKTFPDELWIEFARLTNWKGSVTQRPKYWGKLVMELVYEYLDEDVAEWLRTNAPAPQGNMSYHRWLTSQYGLRKLVEHIWMLIGMARSCQTMRELRDRMAMQFGREPFLLNMYIPAQQKQLPLENGLGKTAQE